MILDKIRKRWDIQDLPRPKWNIQCPVCRSDNTMIRHWKFHRRNTGSDIPYRCDVSFKCKECSAVWVHGVVIPRELYKKYEGELIHFREVE